MAKSKPKANPSDEMVILARRFIGKHGMALDKHLRRFRKRKGVRSVHQVRVACRRLRSGLKFFGDRFDPADLRRWRRRLRKTLDRFGPARDCDVQIRFLTRMLTDLPDKDDTRTPGIRALRKHVRAHRAAMEPEIDRTARRLIRKGFTEETTREAGALKSTRRRDGMPLFNRAAEHLAREVREIRQRRFSLCNPGDIRGHHELRIAVKRLRYTLELCALSDRVSLQGFVKRLRDLQEGFGEMRDCDGWVELVDHFIAAHPTGVASRAGDGAPLNRLRSGLRYLRAQRRRTRQALLKDVRMEMDALDMEDFWTRLLRAVEPDQAPATGGVPSSAAPGRSRMKTLP